MSAERGRTQRSAAVPPSPSGRTGDTAVVPAVDPVRARLADAWSRLREAARSSTPVPAESGRRVLYGLAQPFLGLRVMAHDPTLLGESIAPAVGVALVCLLAAGVQGAREGPWSGIVTFFVTVVALAPVPSVIFGRHYARIAARARTELGLGPRLPYLKTVSQAIGEWVAMAIVLGIGVAPFTALLGLVPLWGEIAAAGLSAGWALHWVVVEAYDGARTLAPGETIVDHERAVARLHHRPWFVRWTEVPRAGSGVKTLLGLPRALGQVVTRLAHDWHGEIALVERRPWVSLGFGLGAAVVLAIPGLNLLLRPALVIGGAHLRGRLEEEDARAATPCSGSFPGAPARGGPPA